MNFPWENEDKILEFAAALSVLEEQIGEVKRQIYQFCIEKLMAKESGIYKNPMRMKRVVLTWLTAYHSWGRTPRELLKDRDSLQKYSGRKFPRTVEAYSMFLGRLDKRYVTRVKQRKEFRYHITLDGFRHLLDLIKLKMIEEDSRKKAEESSEMAFLASLRTKITSLQMEQMQLVIDKIPGISNTTAAVEIYSVWSKTMIEAGESIRALQFSASRPADQATRESAINIGEEVCNKLLFSIVLMSVLVCYLCASRPAREEH